MAENEQPAPPLTKEQAIEMLREGRVGEWNRLREDNEDWAPDLYEANLVGADLCYANLSGTELGRANMEGVIFWEANLSGSKIGSANLNGAELIGANLEGANFNNANMRDSDLTSTNLEGASLLETNLNSACFDGALAKGVNLARSSLKGAILTEVNLEGANLFKANLNGASFNVANLKNACLREANLEGANIKETNLNGADLRCANFKKTIVTNVKYNQIGKYRGIILSDCYGSRMFSRFAQDMDFLEELQERTWSMGKSEIKWGRAAYLFWRILADCGRGRGLIFLIVWTLVLAFYFAMNYYMIGEDSFKLANLPWGFATTIYYSFVTLTTLGFGDIAPTTTYASFWVMAEVITGYVMLGALISVLAQVLARRS